MNTVGVALSCEPERLQQAVDGLFAAGYPVIRPPITPGDLDWLRGPRRSWLRRARR